MSRRSLALTAAAAVSIAIALPFAFISPHASATPLAGPLDRTAPYGPFGFTTQGLNTKGDLPYGEPSLAMAPDGRHLVASVPGGGGVQYWYSANNGRTWAHTQTTPFNGGGDSELDFLPDGSIVSADLRITDSYIQRSTDFGKTWKAVGPAGLEQDRQWFAHSPDGKTEYLVYHDFVLEGEFFAKSTNGGKTWSTLQAAHPVNSPGQFTTLPASTPANNPPNTGSTASFYDQGVNTFSGPMLVDNNGKDLYVIYSISNIESNLDPSVGVPPFGPVRGLVVAHSGDGGASWTNTYADRAQPDLAQPAHESTENSLFPWGTIDKAGNVYIVFSSTRGTDGSRFHLYYTVSKDKGAHWSAPLKLDTLGLTKGSAIYATGAGGSDGVLDVGWYQTDTGKPADDNSTWTVHFAQVTGATSSKPDVTQQAVTTIPNHKGGICLQGILCGVGPGSSDRSLLDFFEVAINPQTGLAGIVYADNNRLGPSEGQIGEVVYAAQTRGPSAFVP
ncbi:MAG: hypothetical protein QOF57_183, partial [Frankiaceae bacterium]|nr:hypothetical protein [Frankiaceae bacterium]